MRRRVADDVESFRIALGHDRDGGILIDQMRSIDELAVDLAGERRLGEAGSDRRGEFGNGEGRVEVLDGAIGQSNVGHR